MSSWPIAKKASFTEGYLWSFCLFYFLLFLVACFVYCQDLGAKTAFALVAIVHFVGAVRFSWQRHVQDKFKEIDKSD